jgi:phage-related protein
MTTPFPFPNKITIDIQNSLIVNEVKATFGDGYEQVGGKGVKPVLNSLSLTIIPLSKSETLNFEHFLTSVGIWGIISLIPPFQTSQVLYRIKGNVKKSQVAKELWSFSLTLLEV